MSTLEFGVKPSVMIQAATVAAVIGSQSTKSSRVIALGAILSGASIDTVASATAISPTTLKRIAAIARNGRPPREGFTEFTPAAIATMLKNLDWQGLTKPTASQGSKLDATIAAARLWDKVFIDDGAKKPSKAVTASASATDDADVDEAGNPTGTGTRSNTLPADGSKITLTFASASDLAIALHDILTSLPEGQSFDVWESAIMDALATAGADLAGE